MKNQSLLLIGFITMNVFAGATAHGVRLLGDTEPLFIPNYNMTKGSYLSINTSDTDFNKSYVDYGLYVYSQSYAITSRPHKIATGTLTFTFDVNQTTWGWLIDVTKTEKAVKGSVWIEANVVKSFNVPGSLSVDRPTLLKVLAAYVNKVVPNQISIQVILPEKLVNVDSLKAWNLTYSHVFSSVPDVSLKFHDFTSNLTDNSGPTGKITLLIDAYSPFLSYTPRFKGKPLILSNVAITIQLAGDVQNPTITIDPSLLKPFNQNEIRELLKGYYYNVAVPAVKALFS